MNAALVNWLPWSRRRLRKLTPAGLSLELLEALRTMPRDPAVNPTDYSSLILRARGTSGPLENHTGRVCGLENTASGMEAGRRRRGAAPFTTARPLQRDADCKGKVAA